MPLDPARSAFKDFPSSDLKKPNGDVIKDARDVGFNPVKYFPITDKEPSLDGKRSRSKTAMFVMRLATHGEARRNTEFCVLCHNPSHTDEEKRNAVCEGL